MIKGMQAYQGRNDDIEVSQMHVFAVSELGCKHIDKKLKKKQQQASMELI